MKSSRRLRPGVEGEWRSTESFHNDRTASQLTGAHLKLSLRAIVIAGALFNAICFLFVALMNLILPPYGGKYLDLLTTFYIGYHPETGPISIVLGLIYALVAGAIEGALFGWLYNLFVEQK